MEFDHVVVVVVAAVVVVVDVVMGCIPLTNKNRSQPTETADY